MADRYHYGGQAVMEGVMIKGQNAVSLAVRNPSGAIVYHSEELNPKLYKSRAVKMPFVRGLIMLWDMMVLGTRMLMYSANIAVSEEVDEKGEKMELGGPWLWVSVLVGIAFAIGLFFVVPLLLSGILDRTVGNSLVSNLVEGALRLGLLIGYLWAIGRIPDISRVFLYHGAEHKTINAYEAGEPLDVEHVRRYPTAHTRCGTGFLLVVVLLCILLFSLMGRPPMVLMIASRILLVPVVAAIAYEFIKFTAKHQANPVIRALIAPSMALQALTTKEPDDSMLEVGIASLKHALATDGVAGYEIRENESSETGEPAASLAGS